MHLEPDMLEYEVKWALGSITMNKASGGDGIPVELPWTVACQAPLSIGFFRQEYWSGLLFSSPANLADPGIEPASSALAGRFFYY